ncbi:hypothetical protein [Lignipirellula cremea]|uniref:Uncharacterized protein n=1 Tax=Lignipirellula cremea TaxID=2528010 RepID=A0A518DQM5_9BACT|nr:hypothetical protein [Lignipirellula cremea]QDU94124.1 hypothetical protein Pla8534_19100 [Lignipirellula cremea]
MVFTLSEAPTFPEYPTLVIVLSAEHDADMGWNHLLHVEQAGHQISRYWPCDPERDDELEAIVSDGFDPDNVVSESLYSTGIDETIRRFGNSASKNGFSDD